MSIFQKNSENIFLKLCTQLVQNNFVSIYGNKIMQFKFLIVTMLKKLNYKTKYYFIKVKATSFL